MRTVQPTHIQVEKCLHALQVGEHDAPGTPAPVGLAGTAVVPAGLVDALAGAPAIRDERLADVRQRMIGGANPSADDLAERMVGRLVCDRIR
jgi:hypothetical protein